jgi:cyclopropane-fatty-acyl-phospholipid synthase
MGATMLFKFKSKAASDLIMLEPDARALLHMMLGDDPVKGIVLAQDLPATIARLEAALAQESANSPGHKGPEVLSADEGSDDVKEIGVHVGQRAAPMLQMLKRCLAEKADVVWGV